MRPTERLAWLALALVWTGYLVVRTSGVADAAQPVAKGLLMPTLLLAVLAALGSSTPRSLVAGLVLATVGDIAIDLRFEAGMAAFLGMQACYIAGFLTDGAWAGLRRRWPFGVAYAVVVAAANLMLGPELGDLRIPVLVYSTAIGLMAALAVGMGPRVALGAALFVVSDALIAAGEAGVDLPARAALVMPTYLAAQYLIATGWARRVDPTVRLPV